MNEYPEQSINTIPSKPSVPVEEIVTYKEWLGSLALLMIPFVNIVLMFVWAFSSDVKKSKSNFFKASLTISAIVFGIYIIFIILLFMFMFATGNV